MDLDNLKKTWNDDLFIPRLSENNILHIIHRKGISALGRLFWFEIVGLILMLPFAAIPYLHTLYIPRVPYPDFTKYFFIGCCIIGFFWQFYKVCLLKKIDLKRIDILSGLKTISKYKLYIKREFFVGIAFLFVILVSFSFSYADTLITPLKRLYFLLFNLALFGVSSLILFIFYKYFYKKNIKNIESALEEVKEMEESG